MPIRGINDAVRAGLFKIRDGSGCTKLTTDAEGLKQASTRDNGTGSKCAHPNMSNGNSMQEQPRKVAEALAQVKHCDNDDVPHAAKSTATIRKPGWARTCKDSNGLRCMLSSGVKKNSGHAKPADSDVDARRGVILEDSNRST